MCEYCGCQAVTAIREQDGVFPAALANLGNAGWDAIDVIRARVGTLLPVTGR